MGGKRGGRGAAEVGRGVGARTRAPAPPAGGTPRGRSGGGGTFDEGDARRGGGEGGVGHAGVGPGKADRSGLCHECGYEGEAPAEQEAGPETGRGAAGAPGGSAVAGPGGGRSRLRRGGAAGGAYGRS